MATKIEEILGKQINSVKELRAEIKRLQDEMVKMNAGTEEYNETSKKMVAAQDALNGVLKAGKAEVNANATSIAGLEKEYKQLYNAYKLLSEEERLSPFGIETKNRLKEISDSLNETKKDVGNYKDNIGRYAEGVTEALGKMGISFNGLLAPMRLFDSGFQGLNATMKANPIGLVIIAVETLMALFNKLKGSIEGNEESQDRWNIALAAFQPIADAMANSFDKMGTLLVKGLERFAKVFNNARILWAKIQDGLRITEGEEERVRAEIANYGDIAKREAALKKTRREYELLNKEEKARVENLKVLAASTTDNAKKLEYLNEALELQNKINERSIEVAKEDYQLMYDKSLLTANSTEDNDKLAEAEANVNRIEAEGAAQKKELASQILSAQNALKGYTKEVGKATDAQKDLNKTTADSLINDLYKDDYATQYQKLIDTYTKNREVLVSNGGEGLDKLYENFKNDMYNLDKSFGYITNDKMREHVKIFNSYLNRGNEINANYLNGLTKIVKKEKELEDLINRNNPDWVNIRKEQDIVNKDRIQQFENTIALYDSILTNPPAYRSAAEAKSDEELKDIEEYNKNIDEFLATIIKRRGEIETEFNKFKDTLTTDSVKETIRTEQMLYDVSINNANAILNYLDSFKMLSNEISNILQDNLEAQIKEGKLSEEQIEKKKKALKSLQAVQLAVNIATITGDAAVGITNLWTAYAKKKALNNQLIALPAIAAANATDLATTIIQTTGLATSAAAQIAAATGNYISATKGIGSMGVDSTPSAASPNSIDTTAYSYTRELQTEEEKAENKAPIIVYVEDIKRGLDERTKVMVESTF